MTPQTPPTPSLTPSPESTPTAAKTPFRVIGYVTDAAVPVVIDYSKLTHINYAFLIPNEDGTFVPLLNMNMIGELTRRSHEAGVKVLVSVGGWGWDAQFEAMAAEPDRRKAFVQNVIKVMKDNQFDGVDIDWEYPDEGDSAQNFLALMQELRAALPHGALLTAAVAALGPHAAGIPEAAFDLMDFVNLMAYDNTGSEHSSYDFAQESLTFWLERGLPAKKAVLGVPFYGRGTNARMSEITYGKIVKADPSVAQADSATANGMLYNYNGIPTIKAKTRLAMEKASGIMFWTLEGDAQGDLSLLNAIHEVVTGEDQ